MAFRWLEDVARSPPGLELVSEDGGCFSGVFVVVRNRPLYQLAARHARSHRFASAPVASHHEYRRHPSLFHEDDSVQDERNPLYRR